MVHLCVPCRRHSRGVGVLEGDGKGYVRCSRVPVSVHLEPAAVRHLTSASGIVRVCLCVCVYVLQAEASRFGRGGVIDDVLLTGRDDYDGDGFAGSLPSIGSAGLMPSLSSAGLMPPGSTAPFTFK